MPITCASCVSCCLSQKLVQARVVGGGARSQAWNQIKADVLGIPYQSLTGNEFGTWGAAMIAGKAAGVIDDLAEHASADRPHGRLSQPSQTNCNHNIYEPLVAEIYPNGKHAGSVLRKTRSDLVNIVTRRINVKKQVRICMIGAGRVGRNHSNAITRHVPDGKIVALVDPVESVRKETATDFGIENSFDTLEQALDKVEFDAVVITTPTPTHLPLAALAAEHGKHVFLEKPMALNLEECDAIMAADRKEQSPAAGRFHAPLRPPSSWQPHERIEAGEIGTPMMIKSNTHGPGLPPPWARDLRTSNGMLAEVNSHDWDTTRWFMGSNYERVYTEVANFKGAANNVDVPQLLR